MPRYVQNKDERLKEMQEAAKKRYFGVPIDPVPFKAKEVIVKTVDPKPVADTVVKKKSVDVDFNKVRLAAKKLLDKKSVPNNPESPTPISRPKAEYSNSTPYGIAKEFQ